MPSYQNQLLNRLSEEELTALGPLELVPLALRQELSLSPSDFAYFIETGVASVVADINGKAAVELGIVGREGMLGLTVVYGDDQDPYNTFMQVDGSAYRLPASALRKAMENNRAVRELMLRFARALSIQVATTAIANGRSKIDERLARWLLMVGDRVGSSFPITHEFISVMLGVRRSGVTLAIQILEGQGLIRATRGAVTILNRSGLVTASNGAYGFAERHYERLLGATH